jgi:hypothetical protein
MPAANIGGWIRIGVWALPLYGLLTFWATLTHEPDRQNAVEAYARFLSTTDYLAKHLLGSILGTILAIFGVMALAAYLANSRVGRFGALGDGCERGGQLPDPDHLRLLHTCLTGHRAVVP